MRAATSDRDPHRELSLVLDRRAFQRPSSPRPEAALASQFKRLTDKQRAETEAPLEALAHSTPEMLRPGATPRPSIHRALRRLAGSMRPSSRTSTR